jgi:hypothetical protein
MSAFSKNELPQSVQDECKLATHGFKKLAEAASAHAQPARRK